MIVKKKLPNFFSREEIVNYFDNLDSMPIAIASLLGFCCGLRIGEVTSLKWDWVNLESGKIKVINGKTGDGYVDIPQKIIPILKRWKYLVSHQEFVLPYPSNNYNSRISILTEDLHKALKMADLWVPYCTRADGKVVNKLTFHGFRHTFATFLWEETGDIYLTKNALRHSQIESTEVYTHLTNPHKKQKINEVFSPNDKIPINPQIQTTQIIENPLQVLQIRLAKGEITLENYKQLLNELYPKQSYIG